MMKRYIVLLLLFLSMMVMAETGQNADPVVEARLKSLSVELRCLVCQNQTLADSSAPLAEDLRNEIREQIQKGMTDKEITDYLVSRYGDFVRYRPPVNAKTYVLWLGPVVILVLGILALFFTLKRRNSVLTEIINEGEEA